MAKQPFASCIFIPYAHRENLHKGSVIYDVSSYGEEPYYTLSPMWVHGRIPIPGMEGKTSDTVEGIWQGLKVIRGATAPRYFNGPGKKRGGKPVGHQFRKKLLNIVEARYKIYRVAYEWVLENRIDPTLIQKWVDQACSGIPQFFHDVASNGDINNANEPLAHASLLVQYLNRLVKKQMDQ